MIRPLQRDDVEPLAKILEDTGVFRRIEIEVGKEVLEDSLAEGQLDYMTYVSVDDAGVVQGYYSAGHTPMTDSTFDMYWIAVHPSMQGKGVGRELLRHCEETVKRSGGRLIVVETSSKLSYDETRKFYARNGYIATARIQDYYSKDDDLVIYTKTI